MTTATAPKIHCRLVDGLPGEPCRTCGRTVVRKGSGAGMYRLTHAKAEPVPAEVVPFAAGDRVNHYTSRMPNGTGTVIAADPGSVAVRWDRTGITRDVPAKNLRPVR